MTACIDNYQVYVTCKYLYSIYISQFFLSESTEDHRQDHKPHNYEGGLWRILCIVIIYLFNALVFHKQTKYKFQLFTESNKEIVFILDKFTFSLSIGMTQKHNFLRVQIHISYIKYEFQMNGCFLIVTSACILNNVQPQGHDRETYLLKIISYIINHFKIYSGIFMDKFSTLSYTTWQHQKYN